MRTCFSRRSELFEPLQGAWRHIPLTEGVCGKGAYSCVHGNRTAWETNEIDLKANTRWHDHAVRSRTRIAFHVACIQPGHACGTRLLHSFSKYSIRGRTSVPGPPLSVLSHVGLLLILHCLTASCSRCMLPPQCGAEDVQHSCFFHGDPRAELVASRHAMYKLVLAFF